MNVRELKSRIILRARDSAASYTAISKNSASLIDAFVLKKYFNIDLISSLLTNNCKFTLKKTSKSEFKNLTSDFSIAYDEYLNEGQENEIISFEDWLFEKQTTIIKKLYTIQLNNNHYMKENGIHTLSLGFPYIEGIYRNFEDDCDVVRGPLILFPVKIVKSSASILQFELLGEPSLNNSILEKYSYFYKVKLENIYDEFSDLWLKYDKKEDSLAYFFDSVISLIKERIFDKTGISINIKSVTKDLEMFERPNNPKRKASTLYEENIVEISYKAVIGLFFLHCQQFINDFDSWEDGDVYLSNIERLSPKNIDTKYSTVENELVNVSPLDLSQKIAIKSALYNNTVIDGPPGTGKSQTIANLLINVINKGKNCLFCAEKQVATNVVYKRLGVFKFFSINIHDIKTEKKNFYENLKNNYEYINDISNSFQIKKNEIEKINKEIIIYEEKINKINALFNSNRGVFYSKLSREMDCEKNNDLLQYICKEIGVKNPLFDFSSFQELELIKKDCINFKTIDEKFNTYNFLKKYIHRLFLVNEFNWKDVSNFEKTIKYFIKKNKLKSNIGFFSSFGLKKIDISMYDNLEEQIEFYEKNKDSILRYRNFKSQNSDKVNSYILSNSESQILDFLITGFLENFRKENQELLELDAIDWKSKINELFIRKSEYVKKNLKFEIASNIKNRINEYISHTPGGNEKFRLFNREINKTIRHISIKDFFNKFQDILKILFPIVICSLDAGVTLVPFKKNFFDYVIFDEASQIFIERAVTLMYRGSNIVVAGDEKQLQPSNFFMKNIDSSDDDLYEDDGNQDDVKAADVLSLLNYVQSVFCHYGLVYHYRSKHRELIEFSNSNFYKNKLVTCSAINRSKNYKPIIVHSVDGIWADNMNDIEANKTVELILKIIKARKNKESIGVITFNKKQSMLVLSKLNELIKDGNHDIESEMNRENEGEDLSLFVKNIEEVQGDERDIIIFSVAFAKNSAGRFLRNFGPINKLNGQYRINVAVTRAKKMIFLIKSINSSDILTNNKTESEGVKIFARYLRYCELLQTEEINSAKVKTECLNEYHNYQSDDSNCESQFEIDVYNFLEQKLDSKKYSLKTQYPAASFRIDIVIWNNKLNKPEIAVECDGYQYHSSHESRIRDIDRQNILENKGWTFFRISSNTWNTKPKDLIFKDLERTIQLKNKSKDVR